MSNAPQAAPRLLTAAEMQRLDAQQRAAYYRTLEPAALKIAQQRGRQAQRALNNQYMVNSLTRKVPCTVEGGSSNSATYTAGSVVTFNVPSALNAFTRGFWLRFDLTVNPATGTSAAYAKTAAAQWAVASEIAVLYQGRVWRFHPHILPTLYKLQGEGSEFPPFTVFDGDSISTMQTYRTAGAFPITVNTANTWAWEFYIPLNPAGGANGLLPTMGGETTAQLQVTIPTTLLGADPVNHAVSATTGSGHSLAVAGTFRAYAVQSDGTSFARTKPYELDISGLPWPQLLSDQTLYNLVTGATNRGGVSIRDNIRHLILTVVDGVQSTKYAATSNITAIEVAKDATGNNLFYRYGGGTNTDYREFYTDLYATYKQDFEEGILPIVHTPNRPGMWGYNGTGPLNTKINQWSDLRYGLEFGALGGVSGVTQRVLVHALVMNSNSLGKL